MKWFVEEDFSDRALRLRDDYVSRKVDIAVPELIYYEVLNSLRYNPDFGMDDLKSITQALDEYDFWAFPLRGELAEGSVVAIKTGITAYDACYIALAKAHSWIMYTADSKLLEKAKHEKAAKHISQYGTV